MNLLQGKVVVVTGGGSGMGRATAAICAREGARVVVSDISGQEEQVAAEIGHGAIPWRCDASKESQVESLINDTVGHYGRIDAMMNVAGVADGGLIDGIGQDMLDKIMRVNFNGVLWGTKYAVRAMKDTGGGVIVNWSSLAGLVPSPGSSIYSASKAAVAHFTRSTAVEWGHANIRANAICPGIIDTEGMGQAALRHDPDKPAHNPLGRAGKPEDAGELAAFLASDRANYINGVVIPLDGGWSIKLA